MKNKLYQKVTDWAPKYKTKQIYASVVGNEEETDFT